MTASLPAPSTGPAPSVVPGAGGMPPQGLSMEGLPPGWAAAVAQMGCSDHAVVTRSSGLLLRQVHPALRDAVVQDLSAATNRKVAALHAAARVGIAPADLLSVARRRPRPSGALLEASDVLLLLEGCLGDFSVHWPVMTLRDALGWTMVFPPRSAYSPGPAGQVEQVDPWVDAGLLAGGWLYAAAGLTPDEARQMLAAGPVEEDRLVTLATLRGVPLPA